MPSTVRIPHQEPKNFLRTEDDVIDTEIFKISETPLTEVHLKNKDIQKPQEKSQTPCQQPNTKVGANYFSALPESHYESAMGWHESSSKHLEDIFKQAYSYESQTKYDNIATEAPINEIIVKLATLRNEPPKNQEKLDIKPELVKIYEEFEIENANLTSNQKTKLTELLVLYQDIWDRRKRERPLEWTTLTTHQIKVDDPPIRVQPQRTNPVKDHIIWKHINQMALQKVIKPSKSPWASPILLADKKNDKIQFYIDFCTLNNVTMKDAYSLP